jgi:hypothetical protein
MPEGTAIDLRASGVGYDNYFYVLNDNDNDDRILIMFAPEGRVSRVTYSQVPIVHNPAEPASFDQSVVDNIYLLVGRSDRVPPVAGNDKTLKSAEWTAAVTEDMRNRLREPINWLNGTSRWIVVGSQTGRITTIENGFVDAASISTATGSDEVKRNMQIKSAREFTREMGRVGGR